MTDGETNATSELEQRVDGKAEWLEERDRLRAEAAALNLTQRQQFLASRFVCRPDPSTPPDRQEYLTVRRDIIGNRRARLVNRCRFDSSVIVDEEHVLGFCCNSGFAKCRYWRSKDEIAA